MPKTLAVSEPALIPPTIGVRVSGVLVTPTVVHWVWNAPSSDGGVKVVVLNRLDWSQ